MRIYLDHAATTPPLPEVVEAMRRVACAHWGNPSSLHAAGREARRVLEEARERIAERLERHSREVLFASSATEANNWVIAGAPDGHVVATAIEHPSVLEALERRGNFTLVPPAPDGCVRAQDVLDAVRPNTVLVSLMLVNNETGAVQPVEEIRRNLRGPALHVDAVQAFGKVPLPKADLLTLSGHKIHGPRGAAVLVMRRDLAWAPLLRGGGQEFGKRAGTENVPAAVGLAEAVERYDAAGLGALRDRLEEKIRSALDGVEVNGTGARACHITNLSFAGVDGEALLMALDLEGVCASTGSACASLASKPSHVLRAMGLPEERVRGSMRFSVGMPTTRAEVDDAAERIVACVRRLRAVALAGRTGR
jgi:cysteine desulfurase